MSALTWVNDFPKNARGTYRIKSDEEGTETEKLALAKKLIKDIAVEGMVDILLDARMQGNRWILIWWPANEPRHQETDQIITGVRETDGS